MRRFTTLGLAAIVLVAASGLSAASECALKERQTYARMADLPADAMAALKVRMAEKGAPYQRSDVMLHPNLPLYQFLRADRTGCRLRIEYLKGGFLLQSGAFLLKQSNGKWRSIASR